MISNMNIDSFNWVRRKDDKSCDVRKRISCGSVVSVAKIILLKWSAV